MLCGLHGRRKWSFIQSTCQSQWVWMNWRGACKKRTKRSKMTIKARQKEAIVPQELSGSLPASSITEAGLSLPLHLASPRVPHHHSIRGQIRHICLCPPVNLLQGLFCPHMEHYILPPDTNASSDIIAIWPCTVGLADNTPKTKNKTCWVQSPRDKLLMCEYSWLFLLFLPKITWMVRHICKSSFYPC